MRQSVVGSALVHVALLVALFAFRVSADLIVAGSDVVQVSLIDPGALRMPAPPPPVQTPEPVRERLVPQEDVGVKITPPAKPRTPEVEAQPKPEPATPASALPYVSIGPTGLRGSLSVDRGDFEFTYYLVIVRNRIAQNWTPPAGLVTGGQPVRGVIYFRIARDGGLSHVRIETESGYSFFDRSALRSVQISHPMPPLPVGFPGSDLGVHFGFEYAAP